MTKYLEIGKEVVNIINKRVDNQASLEGSGDRALDHTRDSIFEPFYENRELLVGLYQKAFRIILITYKETHFNTRIAWLYKGTRYEDFDRDYQDLIKQENSFVVAMSRSQVMKAQDDLQAVVQNNSKAIEAILFNMTSFEQNITSFIQRELRAIIRDEVASQMKEYLEGRNSGN